MVAVFNWALEHWFLIFLLSVLGVFEGIRDFFVDGWNSLAKGRHKRKVALLKAQAELERARSAGLPALAEKLKPGPCVHRNVVPVVSKAEDVVAWLCRSCDERLPANWAVREEDL